MIRFIIKRKTLDRGSGCEQETFETFDVDVPDLERALLGGHCKPMEYDVRQLFGVEVLPPAEHGRQASQERLRIAALIRDAWHEREASNGNSAGEYHEGVLAGLDAAVALALEKT